MGKVPLLTLAIEAATPSTGSSLIGYCGWQRIHQSQPTHVDGVGIPSHGLDSFSLSPISARISVVFTLKWLAKSSR